MPASEQADAILRSVPPETHDNEIDNEIDNELRPSRGAPARLSLARAAQLNAASPLERHWLALPHPHEFHEALIIRVTASLTAGIVSRPRR